MSQNITTGLVRFSYAYIFTPRAGKNPGDEEKYSITLLIPKNDQATMNAIMAGIEEAKQEGLAGAFKGIPPQVLPTPIHDGDGAKESGEPYGPECRGHWVITASNKRQPFVVDANVQPVLQPTLVYSGCYGKASIRFFPYTTGKKGIGCSLNGIQKIQDGEPLGGGITADEAFGANPGFAPAAPMAPGYGQPATPAYGQPAAPTYQAPQQPAYQAPAQPQYQPQYQQPAYQPAPTAPYQQPAQPGYGQPAGYPQQQIDPITGAPIAGGVMGI